MQHCLKRLCRPHAAWITDVSWLSFQGVGGEIRQRHDRARAEQRSEVERAQVSGELAQYKRAFAACMQGRGYAVN